MHLPNLDAGELRDLGIERPLDRALIAAGWCLLAACALPISHDGDRALFFVDFGDAIYDAAACAAQIFAGLVFLALGRSPLAPRHKAIAATAPVCLWAVVALQGPASRAAILPFFPVALQNGALWLLAGLVFGAASLRSGDRRLLAAAIFSLVALYVWPAGLVASMASDLHLATGGQLLASTELEGLAVSSLIASSMPLFLAAFLLLRAREPRRARERVLWFLLPVLMLLELGLRSSTEYGIDGHLGIAIRSALVLFAFALPLAYAVEALAEDRVLLRKNAVATFASISSAAAVALLVHASATRFDRAHWDAGAPPAWAEHLYRDLLPELSNALDEDDPLQAIEALRVRAVAAAEQSPRLTTSINELTRLLAKNIEPDERELNKALRRLNESARREHLPFYLDANVRGPRDIWFLTYRVREARPLVLEDREVEALWIERYDHLAVIEQRLGWKPAHDRRALVLLDAVRARWKYELAPALEGTLENRYTPHRERLLAELSNATGLTDPLADPERAMQAIAESVEAHEVMHVLDDDSIIPPREVRASHLSFRSAALHKAAASELSAYLAEISRSPVPTLALIDLLVFANSEAPRPEAIAARIARELLLDGEEFPLDLPARARAAHRDLFGREVPPSVAVSPASNTRTNIPRSRSAFGLNPASSGLEHAISALSDG